MQGSLATAGRRLAGEADAIGRASCIASSKGEVKGSDNGPTNPTLEGAGTALTCRTCWQEAGVTRRSHGWHAVWLPGRYWMANTQMLADALERTTRVLVLTPATCGIDSLQKRQDWSRPSNEISHLDAVDPFFLLFLFLFFFFCRSCSPRDDPVDEILQLPVMALQNVSKMNWRK